MHRDWLSSSADEIAVTNSSCSEWGGHSECLLIFWQNNYFRVPTSTRVLYHFFILIIRYDTDFTLLHISILSARSFIKISIISNRIIKNAVLKRACIRQCHLYIHTHTHTLAQIINGYLEVSRSKKKNNKKLKKEKNYRRYFYKHFYWYSIIVTYL